MKFKSVVILYLFMFFMPVFVVGNSYDWVRADDDYCRLGICRGNLFVIGNLSIAGTFFNATVVDYNITGKLYINGLPINDTIQDLIDLNYHDNSTSDIEAVIADNYHDNSTGDIQAVIDDNYHDNTSNEISFVTGWNNTASGVVLYDTSSFVGIGSTVPGEKLTVSGNMSVSENATFGEYVITEFVHSGDSETPITLNLLAVLGQTALNDTEISGLLTVGSTSFWADTLSAVGSGVVDIGTITNYFRTFFVETVNATALLYSQQDLRVDWDANISKDLDVGGDIEVWKNITLMTNGTHIRLPMGNTSPDYYWLLGGSAFLEVSNTGGEVPIFNAVDSGLVFDFEEGQVEIERNNGENFEFGLAGANSGVLRLTGHIETEGLSDWHNGTLTERDGSLCYVYNGRIKECP